MDIALTMINLTAKTQNSAPLEQAWFKPGKCLSKFNSILAKIAVILGV